MCDFYLMYLHQNSPENVLNKLQSHFNTRPLSLSVSAGNFKGLCKQIDHFPEDADYEADAGEYFLRKLLLCVFLSVVQYIPVWICLKYLKQK